MSSLASSSLYAGDSAVRYKKRKANFTFSEVHILLDEVRKNRHIVVGEEEGRTAVTVFHCTDKAVQL